MVFMVYHVPHRFTVRFVALARTYARCAFFTAALRCAAFPAYCATCLPVPSFLRHFSRATRAHFLFTLRTAVPTLLCYGSFIRYARGLRYRRAVLPITRICVLYSSARTFACAYMPAAARWYALYLLPHLPPHMARTRHGSAVRDAYARRLYCRLPHLVRLPTGAALPLPTASALRYALRMARMWRA